MRNNVNRRIYYLASGKEIAQLCVSRKHSIAAESYLFKLSSIDEIRLFCNTHDWQINFVHSSNTEI